MTVADIIIAAKKLPPDDVRYLMRRLGEALLPAGVDPTEPAPRAIPLRDGEVLLVRRMHRASWARDLEPQ